MSKKEFLQEKMLLLDNEKEVAPPPSYSNTKNVLALQAEIEQAEILLQGFASKNKGLDTKILENEILKAQAQEELNLVKQNVSRTTHNTNATAHSNRKEESDPTATASESIVEQPVCRTNFSEDVSIVNTKTEIMRCQTQKAK